MAASTPGPDWALIDHWADSDGFTAAWTHYNELRRVTGMREVLNDFIGLEDSNELNAFWNDQQMSQDAAMLYGAMLMWAIVNGEPPPRTHDLAWMFRDIEAHRLAIRERFDALPSEPEEPVPAAIDPLGRWLELARCPQWCGQHSELTAEDARNGVVHAAAGRFVGEVDGPLVGCDRLTLGPIWEVPPLYDRDGNVAADAFDGPFRQIGLQRDDDEPVNLSVAQAEQLARLLRPAVFYTKEG